MAAQSLRDKSLVNSNLRAIAVAKGKPYVHLPPQSTLAAIVRHGGLYTLLDPDMMTGRIAAFVAAKSAGAPAMATPQMVQKLRSTADSFFYRLVDKQGYNVHSELMAYISEPGEKNGVAYDEGIDPSPNIPAAFTFVGQFIDHDLTFNGMNLTANEQGNAVIDDASPVIDLDSVYGPRAAAGNPEIYNRDGTFRLEEFSLDETGRTYHDQRRAPDSTNPCTQLAYIFDPRNDENQLILQIHILVQRLHNKIVSDPNFKSELDKLTEPTDPGQIVNRVREEVVAIWQSFILNDYLPKIIRPEVLDYVKQEIRKKAPDAQHLDQEYGDLKHKPYRDLVTGKNVLRLPHEFAIAFRFGHSQLRPVYKLNQSSSVILFKDARHSDVVEIAGKNFSGLDDMRGGRKLEPKHVIDWNVFYPDPPTPETRSLRIDSKVTARVFNLPESAIPDDIKYIGNLPHRNLIRGSQIGVVSGEELATFYGVTPLTPAEVLGADNRPASRELFKLDHVCKDKDTCQSCKDEATFKTPLWYYILKEAEVHSNGTMLGKVGSRLIAEVLMGALYYGNEFAYDDNWKPKVINVGSASNAITLRDILKYVGELKSTGTLIYVEGNDPTGNAIFAFERNNTDGSLKQISGSPFTAGGLGIPFTTALGPFDLDQAIISNSTNTLLFAVNGGSDTIAVFNINVDGSLVPVVGSPFPSGGSNPVSVGLSNDNVLVVVNQSLNPANPGSPPPNYTSFRVSPQGQLTPIPSSTISINAGANPTQALISPDGSLMFGAEFLGGMLRSLKIQADGSLVQAVAQRLPASEFNGPDEAKPLGLAVHPTQKLLYVCFVLKNRLGVYSYGANGKLNFLRSVPVPGQLPCWVLINRAATRLYTSNTRDPSISVFDISGDPGTPLEIQTIELKSTGSCYQFALDSTETFLHVVTQGETLTSPPSSNAVNTLAVGSDGKLTEATSSPNVLPVATKVRPQGVKAL
jgi:6-phosphogluconolactonase (cycloisomerase 2 family)